MLSAIFVLDEKMRKYAKVEIARSRPTPERTRLIMNAIMVSPFLKGAGAF
jgi:hypothetical protein